MQKKSNPGKKKQGLMFREYARLWIFTHLATAGFTLIPPCCIQRVCKHSEMGLMLLWAVEKFEAVEFGLVVV